MPAELVEISKTRNLPKSSVPLVLIHDGGGTIYQYHLLGPLNRDVYGIANPYFDSGIKAAGGIPELAMDYAEAIRRSVGSGPVIIGGWSFGGLMSFEVAHVLASNPDIHVLGLLIIDSFCPWAKARTSYGRVQPIFLSTTTQAMRDKVITSFDNARHMILEWDQPPNFTPPPAAMIRAMDEIRLVHFSDELQPSRNRDGNLGWSEIDSVEFRTIVDVPGDHFSMFDITRLESLTDRIKEACDVLENDGS